MNGAVVQNSDNSDIVDVILDLKPTWHTHIGLIVTFVIKQLASLFRSHTYFLSFNLYKLYLSQALPNLEYYSHV